MKQLRTFLASAAVAGGGLLSLASTPLLASPCGTGMAPYAHPAAGYGAPPPRAYGNPHRMPMPAMMGQGYPYRLYPAAHGSAQPRASQPATEAQAESASDVRVNIAGMQFQPARITVKAGETVTWVNQAGMPHTVDGRDNDGLASGTLQRGAAFSHTFEEPGTYAYYCALHPGMSGTVVVE